jgi:hypothetical protein
MLEGVGKRARWATELNPPATALAAPSRRAGVPPGARATGRPAPPTAVAGGASEAARRGGGGGGCCAAGAARLDQEGLALSPLLCKFGRQPARPRVGAAQQLGKLRGRRRGGARQEGGSGWRRLAFLPASYEPPTLLPPRLAAAGAAAGPCGRLLPSPPFAPSPLSLPCAPLPRGSAAPKP